MIANLPILWADKINSPELKAVLSQYGPEYCFSAEEINQLRNAVNEMAVIQQATFMGTAEPATTPTGIGNRYWTAVTPGPYTNFGGVVVGANSLAIISVTAAGVFSVSQTAFDISGKLNVSDVIDTLFSTEATKPGSANNDRLLNEKFGESLVQSKKEYNPFVGKITGNAAITVDKLRSFLLGMELNSIAVNETLYYSVAIIEKAANYINVEIYKASDDSGTWIGNVKTFYSEDITNPNLLIKNGEDYILINPTVLAVGSYSGNNYRAAGLSFDIFKKDNSLLINSIKNKFIDISNELEFVDNFYISTSGFPNPNNDFKYSKKLLINPYGLYNLSLSFVTLGEYAIVSFYDKNEGFISSINQSPGSPITILNDYKLIIPPETKFMVLCGLDIMTAILRIDVKTSYTLNKISLNTNQFAIPRYIDAVVNRQTQFYLDGVSSNPNLLNDGSLKLHSSNPIVRRIENAIRIEPTAIGTIDCTLGKRNKMLNEEYSNSFSIRAVSKSNGNGGTQKNVCVAGDSLIESESAVLKLYAMLTTDADFVINPIGIYGAADRRHEGRGGWDWEHYTNPLYATTSYSGKTNAFMIGGQLNFKQYLINNFPALSVIDYFIISLGTNDVNQGYISINTTEINNIIVKAKIFLDALLNPVNGFPNCKIAIGLPAVGAPVFSTDTDADTFRDSISRLNQAYIAAFDNGNYHANITTVMHGAYINRKESYQHNDIQTSALQTTTTIREYINNVHPSTSGYEEWGNAYYGKIRAFLNGLL